MYRYADCLLFISDRLPSTWCKYLRVVVKRDVQELCPELLSFYGTCECGDMESWG